MSESAIETGFWISAVGALCMAVAAAIECDGSALAIAYVFAACALVFREIGK